MKIYGLTVINSEGCGDGRESYTHLFTDTTERLNHAWLSYRSAVEEDGEYMEYIIDSFVEFAKEVGSYNYVVGQWPDYHMQWEFFEQDI